jgi:hypothetical protein
MKTELYSMLEPYVDGDWVYEQYPEFHPIAEYEQVQQQYLSRCRAFPGVRSVWTVGEIGVVGISDIDFVVGFADPLPNGDSESLSIHRLDAPGPYVVLHQPLFLSESLLKELFSWRYVSKAECWYGDPTGIHVLPQEQLRIMKLVSLSDIFVQLQPRLLLRTLLSHRMHVRGTLCQINALKHTLSRYSGATRLATTEWDSFILEFVEFRRRWFELGTDRVDCLRTYVAQAIAMLFELMAAYHQALVDQAWFRPGNSREMVRFLAPGFRTRFVARWDPRSALAYTLSEWQRSREVSLELPLAFFEPLRSYLGLRGWLGSHVKQYLWPRGGVPDELWQEEFLIMAARDVRTRDAQVDFLLRSGLLWDDANYSSLGLWPVILTDRSLRGRLRRPYRQMRKWRKIMDILLAGADA